MGVVFFLAIILIIFEIYIRITKQNLNELLKRFKNKKVIIPVLIIIILFPIGFIIGLKSGVINYYPENVRELHDISAIEKDKGIILSNEKIKINIYNQLNLNLDEELYLDQISSITEIVDLETKEFSDLTHFINLEKLVIKWSSDINLLPIQNLSKLKYLEFDYLTNIDNIDYLKNLTNLEYLKISSNRLTNISALENLINLKELHLSGSNLRDFSPLEKMMNLEILYINGVKIEDIENIN